MAKKRKTKRRTANTKPLTLDESVAETKRLWDLADVGDTSRLRAALHLDDQRKRVEVGEAGDGVEWWTWYDQNYKGVRSRADRQAHGLASERQGTRPLISLRNSIERSTLPSRSQK